MIRHHYSTYTLYFIVIVFAHSTCIRFSDEYETMFNNSEITYNQQATASTPASSNNNDLI